MLPRCHNLRLSQIRLSPRSLGYGAPRTYRPCFARRRPQRRARSGRTHARHTHTREDRPSTHRPTRSASPRAWAQSLPPRTRPLPCPRGVGCCGPGLDRQTVMLLVQNSSDNSLASHAVVSTPWRYAMRQRSTKQTTHAHLFRHASVYFSPHGISRCRLGLTRRVAAHRVAHRNGTLSYEPTLLFPGCPRAGLDFVASHTSRPSHAY